MIKRHPRYLRKIKCKKLVVTAGTGGPCTIEVIAGLTSVKDFPNQDVTRVSGITSTTEDGSDSDGNAILDAMAGLWCVNVGYGRDELVNAATQQMQKLPYYNSFFKIVIFLISVQDPTCVL